MLKKCLIGLSLLAASSVASADYIVSQEKITGFDMAGMTLTIKYDAGADQTGTWGGLTNTPLMTSSPILDANGFTGGVIKPNWQLTQAGFTLGGFADNDGVKAAPFDQPYGLWTVTNKTANRSITGFIISGMPGDIAFDSIAGPTIGTPGSAGGQEFIGDSAAQFSYMDQVDVSFNDLFWTLDVLLGVSLGDGESFTFFADTDKLAKVSAPTSIALTLAGFALFMRRQSRNTSK